MTARGPGATGAGDTAERRLAVSEERYRRLFEAARDGILLMDPNSRKITDANPFMEELLGRPRTDLVGLDLFEIGLIRDEAESKRAFERLLRDGYIRYENLPLEARNGRKLEVEFVSNLYEEGGRTVIQCNIRDVTARVAFEREREELLAREQSARTVCEQANRTKDVFLATLSHELRTPLNAVLGWAVLLRTTVAGGGGAGGGGAGHLDIDHGLAVIERNARGLGKLIEDVLDVARVASGKFQLDRRPCDLAAITFQAADAVRLAAATAGVTLDVGVVPGGGSLAIVADAPRLTQAVLNLLGNALKFTPRGGSVMVTIARDGDRARVVVRDTGTGIPPDFLPFIFDRFKQAGEGSARMVGGLGLGLTIVRHIVELHGGSATAWSAGEGRGATFTLELPMAAVGAGAAARPGGPGSDPLPPVRLDGLRVLVVDNEDDARQIASVALRAAGATVTAAASAGEAFLAASTGPSPNVLVSDLAMPGEDGYALIHRLREAGVDVRTMPAVALTAFAGPHERRRALLAGFQVQMAKPVDPYELIAAVASLAGRTGLATT